MNRAEQIKEMTELGFTQIEIAKRLGITDRTVRRHLKKLNIKRPDGLKIDNDIENRLRDYYLHFETGNKAAHRFGISRQALLK